MSLVRRAEGLWTADAPHRFFGLRLGARMTVLRLPDGTFLIHSPVAMTGALRDAVDALGAVAHVVSPNLYHHVYAGAWKAAYPHAKLHGPARLARKRRDLRFDAELSARADPAWGGALVPVPIDGCALHETVFVPPGVVDPRRRRRYLPRPTAGAHCSHSAEGSNVETVSVASPLNPAAVTDTTAAPETPGGTAKPRRVRFATTPFTATFTSDPSSCPPARRLRVDADLRDGGGEPSIDA